MAKEVFEIDYVLRTSPRILYDFCRQPTHLSQWFCDKVDYHGDQFTFIWNGYSESAILIDDIEEELVAYHWDGTEDDEFFEFAINVNEISGDTILTINDFAEAGELADQKLWWDNQIQKLIRVMGC